MIDLHAHVVLEGVLGRAGALGPELVDDPDCPTFRVGDYVLEGVRYRGSAFMDLDVRLARMDELGIAFQVLSPNPLTYLAHAPAELAAEFARWHNDEMAALVAQAPARVAGFAQLPMQEPALAAAELRRAVEELGLAGACVGTDYGIELDDARYDAVWATAVELDVPVVLHPAPPGIDAPLADPRLRRFDLDLWLSFTVEETLSVATLIFGGVLDRHPELRVCISHGGGALVAVIGKLRRVATGRPWVAEPLREPGAFDAALRRVWFDGHVSDPEVLAVLVALVGADRVVGGTNLAGWDQPLVAVPSSPAADQAARTLLGSRFAARPHP